MTTITPNFEFLPITLISAIQGTQNCFCAGCGRSLTIGEAVFIDRLAEVIYCDIDGKQLRYHMKKAFERNEELPITFAAVEARFLQRI